MQLPVFRPGFFAATGYFQHEVEHLPAHVFNGFAAVGDGAGVDVHQIVPTPR